MTREERIADFDKKMALWREKMAKKDPMSEAVNELMKTFTLNPYSDFPLIKAFAIKIHNEAIEAAKQKARGDTKPVVQIFAEIAALALPTSGSAEGVE